VNLTPPMAAARASDHRFDVAVIVVTWNAKDVVRRCLASLAGATAGLECQLIVVDNASSDGTPEMVEREFPVATLIRNRENAGFARANNAGLRLARARYVCLINSDVIVPPDCLPSMAAYMDANPLVGLLGPRMLDAGGAPGPSCMRRPSLRIALVNALGLARWFPGSRLHLDNFHSRAVQPVDVLNGWFWMARAEAVDQVGPLGEEFFMYGEDIDWCDRFWAAGWPVVYFPQASAVHLGGASSARAPLKFYVEMQRANMQYWRRRHSLPSRAAYFALAALHHLVRVAGYGLAFLFRRAKREEAAFKVARSCACLSWLAGFRRRPKEAAGAAAVH